MNVRSSVYGSVVSRVRIAISAADGGRDERYVRTEVYSEVCSA
jgi:hypothetical protein